MPKLFSYRVRSDFGSAPNPFGGLCTLAICKPKIRRAAKIGDWIVGTGSSKSPIGDISHKVVYIMRVTDKMTMIEYDEFTKSKLPDKIPDMASPDTWKRAGDSIYNYATHSLSVCPVMRLSVHSGRDINVNRIRDLSGIYVLLSDYFFYFGNKPEPLPEELFAIVPKGQGRGHRSQANDPYVDSFIHWIQNLKYKPGIIGSPQLAPWISQLHPSLVPLQSIVRKDKPSK